MRPELSTNRKHPYTIRCLARWSACFSPISIPLFGRKAAVCQQATLGFSSGGGSLRLIYLTCPKSSPESEDLTFRVGPKGMVKERFDSVCVGKKSSLDELNPERNMFLVEVEVNNGRGCPSVDAFVATRLTVLDGSTEYPLSVDATVRRLQRESERALKDQRRVLDQAMLKVQHSLWAKRSHRGLLRKTKRLS